MSCHKRGASLCESLKSYTVTHLLKVCQLIHLCIHLLNLLAYAKMLIVDSFFVKILIFCFKIQSLNSVLISQSVEFLFHFNFSILLSLKQLKLLKCFFFLKLQLKVIFFCILLKCFQSSLRNNILRIVLRSNQ